MKSVSLPYVTRISQVVLASTLAVSALLSLWIVVTDGWLRAVAPSHEYGLLGFAVVDLVLALIVFAVPRLADAGAFVLGIVQALAMLGDAFTFTPDGTMQVAFRAYVLTDFGFVGLLLTQLVLASIAAITIVLSHLSMRRIHGIRAGRFRLP